MLKMLDYSNARVGSVTHSHYI